MGWPQWIMTALLTLQCLAGVILHGQPRDETKWDAGKSFVSASVMAIILTAGGFWRAYHG